MSMGALTAYALATAIFLVLGLLAVRIAGTSRASIIGIYLFSLASPLVAALSVPRGSTVPAVVENVDFSTAMEAVEYADSPIWPRIVVGLYIIGVGAMFIYTIFQYTGILKLICRGKHTRYGAFTLVEVKRTISPFNWGKYIVVSENEDERDLILRHEQAHLNRRHYLDLLLARAVCIFQWFNPASRALLHDLQTIHEYQVDSDVLESGVDVREYQLLLLRRTIASHNSFVNSFDNTNLKKRILMMNKKAKSGGWQRFRVLALAPALAAAFGLTHVPAVATVLNETSAVQMAADPEPVVKSDVRVEVRPEFPGGEMALMQWLVAHMKYPQRMVEAEIEGREVVGFTVQPDGRVTNFKIIKSLCPEADAEVMRLLSEMPAWEPGRVDGQPVACQYALPVTFKLSGYTSDKGNAIRIISYDTIKKDDTGVVIKNHNAKPSIFVDGEPYNNDINTIDPETIQSVTVSKDSPGYPNGRVDIRLKKSNDEKNGEDAKKPDNATYKIKQENTQKK